MKNQDILISGASIAGPALAYWLRRHGFRPTVVERAPAPRVGGQAIDVRASALEVTRLMGILPEIQAAATDMRGMSFVDAEGNELSSSMEETLTGGRLDSEDVELMRDDLSAILRAATPDTEYLFGDSIVAMEEDDEGVQVAFASGGSRRFHLVVGADGLHSTVRRLAFGPESQFIRHLGTYLSVFTAPNFLNLDRWQTFHQSPGAMVGLYSARNNTECRAIMGFESAPLDYDYRDLDQQRQLLADHFAGGGWETPRLLEAMWDAPDFYFDSMAQIRMDRWSTGRTALVGDAGFGPSALTGQGASLAIVAAYVLAGELKAAGGEHREAFANYELELREFVELNQNLALENPGGPASPESFEKAINAFTLRQD